jgi:hypothetical protein
MSVAVNTGTTYAAMAELRAHRAQLLADLAANAGAQIIAADKVKITSSTHRLSVQAGRFDITV